MNKKYVMAVMAILLITPIAANGAIRTEATIPSPALAIIDTAIDSSLPVFQGRIIQEVCILEWKTCPNKTSFMEGPGSAVLPLDILASRYFNHGTQVSSIAVNENKNMNIVFIRMIGNTPTGGRQLAGPKSVEMALQWIITNQQKYNIQAVSISQTHHNLKGGMDYCPLNNKVPALIGALKNINVPVFSAVGNDRDYQKIDWPSCIPDTVAIGATMVGASGNQDEIAPYSNNDNVLLDFFTDGSSRAFVPGGAEVNAAGTSMSSPIAAAKWIAVKSTKPMLSYDQLYKLLKDTSKPTRGRQGYFTKLLDAEAAING